MTLPPGIVACANCRFFGPSGMAPGDRGIEGRCHRYPPQMLLWTDKEYDSEFTRPTMPWVLGSWGCAEGRVRDEGGR